MQHLPGCVSRPIDYLYFSLYLRTGFSLIFFGSTSLPLQSSHTLAILTLASIPSPLFNCVICVLLFWGKATHETRANDLASVLLTTAPSFMKVCYLIACSFTANYWHRATRFTVKNQTKVELKHHFIQPTSRVYHFLKVTERKVYKPEPPRYTSQGVQQ
jgi:hypothetical protein